MSEWFSNMFGLNQPEPKPEISTGQTAEIIGDQLMESMESSANNKITQNSTQTPQQLKSQSSSSSGFQQIIIEDFHTQTNLPKPLNQKPNIQKSQQKINDMQINMYATMNFDQDLNQSISDNIYKNVKMSSFAEQDLMNFSGISANNQSFSELSSGKKEMQDSFSNINAAGINQNSESFSGIQVENQKPRSFLKKSEKPKDDSDMEDDAQDFMQQSAASSHDKVNEYLSVWDIPARKPSYTENENNQSMVKKNTESFSELAQDYETSSNDKKKEVEYEIQMQWSQDGNTKSDLIDLTDLNKSLVAPKIQPIQPTFSKKDNSNQKDAAKKSPVIQKSVNTPQKPSSEYRGIPQFIGMGDSIVMSPVVEKPKKKKPTEQQTSTKNKGQALLPFQIHTKDYVHFIRYGKTQDRLLSQKLLQSLTQFFLIENIMLPIFNIKLIHDVQNEMEVEQKELKLTLFNFSINLYFDLLDKKYPQKMKKFFENDQSAKTLKSQVGTGTKKEENPAFFGSFYKKVFDYLKLNHYSKAQILKKTLEAQLSFLSEYKQSWLQSWSEDSSESQSQEKIEMSKRNSVDLQGVKEKEQYLLKKIAELEILISFEKSEMYCEQKLKEKMQENIWKERKRKLIEDRNFFITQLYSSCMI